MNLSPFAVCIPARDERDLLPRLLSALVDQTSGWHQGHVVLVANNCTDDTASLAKSWAQHLPMTVLDVTFEPPEAHVGSARKLALDTGCQWLSGESLNGVLLTTDADAVVPTDWVLRNLQALASSDIVGGRLIAESSTNDEGVLRLHRMIERYWSSVRRVEDIIDPQAHDPVPRHGDHTGASLAFPVALYQQVGGMAPHSTREDTAFVDRVLSVGARLRHCPDVSVRVSDRVVGRAMNGMAADVARRRAAAARIGTYHLLHPSFWIDRIRARRRLRSAWREGRDLSEALLREGVPKSNVSDILAACPNDIAFVERACAAFPDSDTTSVDVEDAVAIFDGLKDGQLALEQVG